MVEANTKPKSPLIQRMGRLEFNIILATTQLIMWILPYSAGLWMAGLVALPVLFFISIKRLHDFDSSGWWSLLLTVPIINLILLGVLIFKRGDRSDNRFGPPKKMGQKEIPAFPAK